MTQPNLAPSSRDSCSIPVKLQNVTVTARFLHRLHLCDPRGLLHLSYSQLANAFQNSTRFTLRTCTPFSYNTYFRLPLLGKIVLRVCIGVAPGVLMLPIVCLVSSCKYFCAYGETSLDLYCSKSRFRLHEFHSCLFGFRISIIYQHRTWAHSHVQLCCNAVAFCFAQAPLLLRVLLEDLYIELRVHTV